MNFRNISAWSIRNPVVPLVLFAALLLAGIMSFMQMQVQDNPDIEFPAVDIRIAQPGAAPTEIETQITQHVESAVRSLNGVETISSNASEGSSSTTVQFEIGSEPDQAVIDVKNAIDQIRGSLPDGILEPRITKQETSSEPIAYFAVGASDMTLEQLSWFVDDTVAKRLLAIEGMAAVDRAGGVDREIRVVLDSARMQSLGVTAGQINQALRQTNINTTGGRAEIAGSRQSVRVLGNADTAFQLGETQIPLGGGRTIRLQDVAKVSDSYSEVTRIGRVGSKDVVTFGITRARGASDVSVYDEAAVALKELEEQNPGVKFTQLFTSVDYTKGQYHSPIEAMIEGAVLAVIVVFFFLRDWRATVISAIAIPLSAIPTFWFMDLMGFTLNSLSLLALGLVAGVLVDDAIVEIENIVRHMRMGKSAYQASIDAADEIGQAVVATTFSIVAVFLPVALMPGISGQFFINFGFTVVIAVLISLAVARMITPMIAAYFLQAHGTAPHAQGRGMAIYEKILAWSLAHRWWMVGIGGLTFAATIALFILIPKQFFPTTNVDFSRIRMEMVPGTTLDRSAQIADQVADIIEAQPETQTALQSIREGGAFIFITLKPDRARSSIEFERALTPELQKIPDARVSFLSQSGGGGTGRDISIMLSGSDPALLEKTAATLVEQMKGLNTVVAPRVNADLRRPEILISPRHDLAAQLGITTTSLSQAIRIATQGEIDQNSAKFSLSDRQVPIRVMLPQDSRRDISIIENLPVPTGTGGTVPLSRVAEIRFGSGPTTIQRYNQMRRIFVGADLAPNVVKGTAQQEIDKLPIMQSLPLGVTNAPFGEDEWQQEMMMNFVVALIAGTLLVFAVLVLLYRRIMSPLVNMGSLLLAPLGGLLALAAMGQPLSLPVFIGILLLFGIVAKNSILLIDFALEEMAKGVSKYDAIMDAGRKRAQPIVMTTVAMSAGMIPTAISLSGDSAWRAPMGTVVIGGLVLSTLLTLLIVPASFSLADGFEKWLAPKFGRLLTYRGPQDHGPAPAPQPAE